jgi:hypothetical protein
MTSLRPFFRALFRRDAAGRLWLPALLAATPHGEDRLGELAGTPGWLQSQLALRSQTGSLGAFEYPAAAPKRLLRWYIDHPDRLVWPDDGEPAATPRIHQLLRALIDDDPPGTRARAQERARELLTKSSSLSTDWWRLEQPTTLDCVLVTERLVVTVVGVDGDRLAPATPWYPPRSRLIHDLEAARHLAAEEKRYATLVLSERPLPEAGDEHVERTLAQATPHLDDPERAELHAAYLGNLTWEAACAAVDVSPATLLEEAGAGEGSAQR